MDVLKAPMIWLHRLGL